MSVSRVDKVKFTCLRCGKCCSSGPNVSLTVSDICRIAKYLGINWRELVGKYIYAIIADYVPVIVLKGINNKCVFLKYVNNTPTCTIYPVRPMRCRLYPFLPVAPGETNKLEISARCPGVGRGDLEEPPWNILEDYLEEVRNHYKNIYELIFIKGLDPLNALETILDTICS